MTKHEHQVAFYDSGDGYCCLTDADMVDGQREWFCDGERFKFCPECGASLIEFWLGIDTSRAAHRKAEDEREERERQRKRLKRESDRRYADAAPWLDSDFFPKINEVEL